jgi:hypothetical protein
MSPISLKIAITLKLADGKVVTLSADDPNGKMGEMLAASKVETVEIKTIKVEVTQPVSYTLNINKGE